jgi:hypothetical protein
MPNMNGFESYGEIKKIILKVKMCFLTTGEIHCGYIQTYLMEKINLLESPIENEAMIKRVNQIMMIDEN